MREYGQCNHCGEELDHNWYGVQREPDKYCTECWFDKGIRYKKCPEDFLNSE